MFGRNQRMVKSENRSKDAPPSGGENVASLNFPQASAERDVVIPPRHEFAHERLLLTMDYCPVQRVTYLGGKREQFVARMDKLFGDGNWTIGYIAGDKILSRDEALNLYERSYIEYFKNNPQYTERLVREARDVYDTNPSNVESGLDWHKQEDSHSHLQDIATRRAISALGLSFQGDKLLQIRGVDSDLPELNPGRVPFVAPELIDQEREFIAAWVNHGSVEDFWQNNKFVFVKENISVVERLKSEVAADLAANKAQNWKLVGERLRALVLMGEASPEMVSTFISNIKSLEERKNKGLNIPEDYTTRWTTLLEQDVRYVIETKQTSVAQMLKMAGPLMEAMVATDPETSSMYLGTARNDHFVGAYFSSFMNHLKDSVWHGTIELLNVFLRGKGAFIALESDPSCRMFIKHSAIMDLSEDQIRESILSRCTVPDETKNRFLAGIRSIRDDPT